MQQSKLLCFNIKGEALRHLTLAAEATGAEICVVAPADFSQSVGALLGVFPQEKSVCLTPFREEMLLMSGFDRGKMEAFLDNLKQRGVSIPFKAMVTPTNLFWHCDALLAELKKEREQLERMKKNHE